MKAKRFIYLNLKGILINNKTNFKALKNPKVSVIIPIYNSQKFVYRAIKSIQNQNFSELEIILINDFSTDNTLKKLKEFQKEDPRIIIINNKKNFGILYSRSIGVLLAKGKYIFSLDNDDMLLNNDVISSITKISIEYDFDIVEFKGVMTFNDINLKAHSKIYDLYYSNRTINQPIHQPELSSYTLKIDNIFKNYKCNSVYLWNKCIKKSIYQKALNKLGKDKYTRYMIAHEDILAVFIIFNTAKSFIYVGKYGYYRILRKGRGFSLTSNYNKYIKEFYLLDAIITFSNNLTKHQKLIINRIYKILELKLLRKIILENESYKNILFNILDSVLNSNFISKQYKQIIISKGKSLKFIDYHLFKNTN